jgi:hypothetical protein
MQGSYISQGHLGVTRELARYKLGLMGIKEVRWDKGGTIREGNYILFYGKGNENRIFCVTQNSINS